MLCSWTVKSKIKRWEWRFKSKLENEISWQEDTSNWQEELLKERRVWDSKEGWLNLCVTMGNDPRAWEVLQCLFNFFRVHPFHCGGLSPPWLGWFLGFFSIFMYIWGYSKWCMGLLSWVLSQHAWSFKYRKAAYFCMLIYVLQLCEGV